MDCSQEKFSKVPIVWKPDGILGKQTRELMKVCEDKYNVKFNDYWDFHKWTVDHISEFWKEMWEFSGIIFSKNYDTVVNINVPMTQPPVWFEGAELNYAENLLKYKDDHTALILTGEDRVTEKVTYAELYKEATLYSAAFRNFGVNKGDVVLCLMSNRKEAILGMLATVSIGAIWTGLLPLLGSEAVLSQVSQLNPKILLTVDRFVYDKEEIEMLTKITEVANGLQSLQKVIIIPSRENSKRNEISKIRNGCWLDDFLTLGKDKNDAVPPIKFEQVPFSYPVFLHFTSGTTGVPKILTHNSGLLLGTTRDYGIHMDTSRNDVFLFFSPAGWATWTIYSTLLFRGLTLVLHEGNPYFVSPTFIWDMVDEFNISRIHFTSTILYEFQKRKYLPTNKHRLTSLKFVMAGSSPVKQTSFDFIYNELKLNVLFSPLYGCTEIMGCGISDFNHPVYYGETPVFSLGTKIECMNEITGESVEGEIGDLVLSTPSPGMVQSLWGDKDGSMINEKYFSKYPGKFLIGDSGYINPVTKGLVVCGRCDDVIKQRGCRFGSSEIYSIVDHFNEIQDSLCVSQYNKTMDERAVLFLKMKEGCIFNDNLVNKLRERVARDLTVPHIPDIIIETKEIPNYHGLTNIEGLVLPTKY